MRQVEKHFGTIEIRNDENRGRRCLKHTIDANKDTINNRH